MPSQSLKDKYDVVIVGGGHNGLVAATYLAQADLSVLVLERLDHTGGAAVSASPFAGLPARLSRYSYLVGVLPDQIVADLGLDLELRSRSVASYTPVHRNGEHSGLLVERNEGAATADSFRRLTGSDREYDAWRTFYGEVREFTEALAPTLLEPLRTAREVRDLVDGRTWDYLVEQPLGRVDRGTLLRRHGARRRRDGRADRHLRRPQRRVAGAQNRCFLYHLIGNGSGEWRVPVGGMGAVTDALAVAARKAGATIVTGAGVSGIESDGTEATVTWHDGEALARRDRRLGALQRRALGAAGAARRGRRGPPRGVPAQGQPAPRPAPPAAVGRDPAERLRRHVPRRRGLQPARSRPTAEAADGRPPDDPARASSTATR